MWSCQSLPVPSSADHSAGTSDAWWNPRGAERCSLDVVPTEVGYEAGWWVALQRGVAEVMIIGVEEGGELCEALGFAGVGARVGPFLFQGAVEPLDLAVGLGPVGAGAFVRDLLAQGGGEGLGPVGGPVVGQHPFDDDPARGEVVIGTVPERGGGFLGLIG